MCRTKNPSRIANCKLPIANCQWSKMRGCPKVDKAEAEKVRLAPLAPSLSSFAVCLFASHVFFAFPGLSLAAEATFPRGEGYYFNLLNLIALLVLYFCWIRTSAWIDEDAHHLHIPTVPWNPLMLGCGVVGMLVVWLLPWFWISFFILLALYLAPSLAYASVRNQRVPEQERVLTEHHFARLAERYLRIKASERKMKKDEGPAIQFIGRSVGQAEEDPARVERAIQSKGYKTAAALVHQAIRFRATDLFLEPNREEMNVRFAVDGL